MTATPGPGALCGAVAPADAVIYTGTSDYVVLTAGLYRIDLWGGPGERGGSGAPAGGLGGPGGYVSVVISLAANQILLIVFTPGADGGPGGISKDVSGSIDNQAGDGGDGGISVDIRTFAGIVLALAAGGGGGGGEGGSHGGTAGTAGGMGASGGAEYPPGTIAGDGIDAITAVATAKAGTGASLASPGQPGTSGSVANVALALPAGAGNPPSGITNNPIVPYPGGPLAPSSIPGQGGQGAKVDAVEASYTPPGGSATPIDQYGSSGGGGGGGGAGYQSGAGGGGGGAAQAAADPTHDYAAGAGAGGGAAGTNYAAPGLVEAQKYPGVQAPPGVAALMLSPLVPAAPVITSPASGLTVDGLQPYEVAYAFQGPGPEEGVIARRLAKGALLPEYYQGTGLGWTTTPKILTPGPLTFDAGTMLNGLTYDIALASVNNGGVGPFSQLLTATFQAAPTVALSSFPTAPTPTQRPTLNWTSVLAPGAVQTGFIVVVDDADGNITNTGVLLSSAQTFQLPWMAVGPYSLILRIFQSGNQPSAELVVTGTIMPPVEPAAPTVIAHPSRTDSQPAVTVVVAGTAGLLVGDLQRSYDGGVTWTSVRFAGGFALGPIGDLEACPGVPILYRACTQTADGTGRSAWVQSQPVVVSPTSSWVVNPVSLQAVQATLVDAVPVSPLGAAVLRGVGSSSPVVLTDAAILDTTTFTFVFLDDASFAAFKAVWAARQTLLVQPALKADQWYVVLGDLHVTYLAPTVRQVQCAATGVAAPPVISP